MWAENKASSRESHDCNKLIIEIEQVSMGARRTHYPIWSLTYAKSNASSQVEVLVDHRNRTSFHGSHHPIWSLTYGMRRIIEPPKAKARESPWPLLQIKTVVSTLHVALERACFRAESRAPSSIVDLQRKASEQLVRAQFPVSHLRVLPVGSRRFP